MNLLIFVLMLIDIAMHNKILKEGEEMEGEKEKWKQREYSHLEGNYVAIRETIPSLWERRVLVTEGGDVLHILTLSQKNK